MKRREVAIGLGGCGKYAVDGFMQREMFCMALDRCGKMLGVFEDESGGLGIGEDHDGIVRLQENRE
jgi:hypothetical protein